MRLRLKILHHLHLHDFTFEAMTSNHIIRGSLNPPSFCTFLTCMWTLFREPPHASGSSQRLLSNSAGLMLASHATSQACLVPLARFNTASSRASFLGVQPSECQKNTEKTRILPGTLTEPSVVLTSLPGIEATAPSSSSPMTAPKLLSDVCFRSSLLALTSVILAVS